MNNKILARLIAAVMAVAMLGTVSFAASLTNDVLDVTADTDSAYAGYGASDVKTFIAYATDDAEADPAAEDIVAIVQNDNGAVPTEFKIDPAKLNDKDYLVVRFGGNGEAAADKTISFVANAGVVTVEDEIIVADKEYTDVAYFAKEVVLGTEEAITNYGFKLKNTAAGNAGNTLYFTDDVVLEAGTDGTYTFSILFTGVTPEQNAAWDVEAFYTVNE